LCSVVVCQGAEAALLDPLAREVQGGLAWRSAPDNRDLDDCRLMPDVAEPRYSPGTR
jgi:hypothetical protein